MKRNRVSYGLIVILVSLVPVVAEEYGEPGEAFDQAFAAYKSELNARLAWSEQAIEAHSEAVADAFAVENGNALVACAAGVIVWNSSLGHVELWLDDEEQVISRGVDSLGRLSFSNSNVAGSLDTVADDHVWLELEYEGTAHLWIGTIERNQATNIIVSVPVDQNTTACVCVGSLNVCPNGRIACRTEATCQYTKPDGTHDSVCKFKLVPA
ncbi:MAG: hypothetical protein HZA51_10450 [Planctomycetes bacterium]|nr:hypothetical protein [Planctomycetota bacterium]